MKKCRRLTLNSGVPLVVYGHIHVPLLRRLPGLTVVNAGSVSQSYDGDRRAAYAVIDGANVTIPTGGIRCTKRRNYYGQVCRMRNG